MRKKLILVAAPPACGKTYVSEQIAGALEHVVLLDKDDLCDLVRTAFNIAEQPFNMDGEFYKSHIRQAEYSTVVNIAFSTLRFTDFVLINAPFGKEVCDIEYMRTLKEKANKMDADLLLIWVTAPPTTCYERMKKRNANRDILKLENWDNYASKINYEPPFALANANAVDSLLVFDNKDDTTFQQSLKETINVITGEKLC